MKLETNKIYSGFQVLSSEFIEEVKSEAYILEHVQSGARVLYLGNQDDNKVFSIGFRTPPSDDTGVAHILEHSVLCGSRKYRLKEPFVELVKGSMNTFLNAMTYPDKTIYPVASRNAKDFQNLVDVYLDAVFYPLIHENDYTLFQEGWHYNLESPEAPLTYNGVVYSEMKGVYSSADAVMDYETMRNLFPDTPYCYESGGYPSAIPTLTQEQFREFHKTYYSPENSYIYLYGDMDILTTLAYLDEEYLSAFTKTGKVNSKIPLQAPFAKTKEATATYPIAPDESVEGKTYLEMNIVTGETTNHKLSSALRLLETVLLESNSAPLRLALLEAGVGSDISGSYAGAHRQPIFSIKAAGSEPEKMDIFVKVIYKTLQELTVTGLDRKLLEAQLNFMEFKLREGDFGIYPKGLIYCLSCMDSWIYDGDPLAGLKYEGMLKELRAGITTGYYEKIIETYLLDNTHKLLMTLLPEPGKEEKEQAIETEKMAALKATFSSEKIASLVATTKTLHERQAAEDAIEALESIPILDRSDIKKEIEIVEPDVVTKGDRTLLYLPRFTNKIAYLNWYFDMSGIEKELLPYAYLLSDILGKVNTKDFSFQELATMTNFYTGGVGFQISAYSDQKDVADYSIRFGVQAKVLTTNLSKLFEILKSVALSSDFSDKKRIGEVVNEVKTDWDSQFFNRGQSIACSRLAAYFSPAARVNEQDYLSYYNFIKELANNFDERFADLQEKLHSLLNVFFHQNKQLFAYSCDKTDQTVVLEAAEEFISALPNSKFAGRTPLCFEAPGANEGIITAGKVQYVAAGGNFRKFGHEYTGAMRVLETVLRYDYLWTKIRVQGGAYGATTRFDRNGTLYIASYRDPKLAETITAYKELPAYLEQFEASERELTKYVIGTISGMDTPLTNSMYLERAAVMNLKNITNEQRQKERSQVLNIQNKDIQNLGSVINDVLSDNYICVVGSQAAIENNKKIFKNIINA